MPWKVGQWVRFEYPIDLPPAPGADRASRGHCFLCVEQVQKARGTFTVRHHHYIFSVHDGSLWLNGRRHPTAGRAVPLTPSDEAWVALELARDPLTSRISTNPAPAAGS